VVVGGRFGYVLFYHFDYFRRIWNQTSAPENEFQTNQQQQEGKKVAQFIHG
jgi:prolipoprotein diacylglyceryltransferase